MNTMGERLKRARIEAGFKSARKAAERYRWGTSTYGAHENGQNLFDYETARKYAKAFGVSPIWLAHGGSEPVLPDASNVVEVAGRIGAGGAISTDLEHAPDGGFYSIATAVRLPKDCIAFEVYGESMMPRYETGDVVVCLKEGTPVDSISDGEEVAVKVSDGTRYLKYLHRTKSKDKYVLLSLNASPVIDVQLDWISEIITVVRARRWRKLSAQERKQLAAAEFFDSPLKSVG